MSDLDFPDLASSAAELVHPPAYDDLVRRAHRRRRVRAAGTVASVAAAVVAVIAISTTIDGRTVSEDPVDTPTSPPATSSATSRPRAPLTAEEVIEEGHLAGVAARGDGAITVWRHCTADGQRCQQAWRLQQGPSSTGVLPGGQLWNVAAVGDRFVLTDGASDRGGLVVSADGSTTPIHAGEPSPVSGDVALVRASRGGRDDLSLVDAARAVRWPLSRPAGVDGWASAALGADGEIWALPVPRAETPGVSLWHSTDGTTWSSRSLDVGGPVLGGPVLGGPVVAAAEHVAALGTFDGATVMPVGDLTVTSDGGATWHDLGAADVPFEFVDSMAATSGGTLYVAGGAMKGGGPMRLYRTTDDTWTHFAEVDRPARTQVGELTAAGAVVLGRTGTYEAPSLVSLDDRGSVHLWTTPIR